MNIENLIAVHGVKAVVLACCEELRACGAPAGTDAAEAVALAEAWARGERGADRDAQFWMNRLALSDKSVDCAAYWLLNVVRRHDCGEAYASSSLEECVEFMVEFVGDRSVVESTILAALGPRDTIPCPPSAECVEHGRAA